MRQLNNLQTAVYLAGALLMVVGAGVSLLGWTAAPWIYAIGAMGFTSMQMLQRYEGPNFVVRRLRRIMLLSDVLFLLTALLMLASQAGVFGLSHLFYVEHIAGRWVLTLLIAAILQLYTTHRIGNELEKEAKKL